MFGAFDDLFVAMAALIITVLAGRHCADSYLISISTGMQWHTPMAFEDAH